MLIVTSFLFIESKKHWLKRALVVVLGEGEMNKLM